MPNDITAKRQKLTSSGFTASIWTISGVVLVACGKVEDFLGLDSGGGGGRSVHVQSSPVQGARIYFDADDSGDVSTAEREAQDAQYPQGFISDATGRVSGIPANLYGKAFVAVLDGAIDADTGEELGAGEYESIPNANGDHTLASPITDFIAKQQGTPEEVIEGILDPTANSETDIAEFRQQILDPNSYLEGGSGVEALAVYVEEQTPTDTQQVRVQVMRHLPETTPTTPADTLEIAENTLDPVTIGEHDRYIGTIEAVSHAGAVRYSFVDASANGIYTINARGVISVIEGVGATLPTGTTTLQIEVSNGADTEMVEVEITVATAPTLEATGAVSGTVAENAMGVDLITGINAPDASKWVIRAPDDLSSKFDVMPDGSDHKLVLKSGESLDYEAVSGGVLNVEVWAENGDEVRSNPLELTITITDANDAPVFLPATASNGLTDGTETIPENTRQGTIIAQVRAADADTSGANSAVSYEITSGNIGDAFSIDNNGAIRVANPLDYETTMSYALTITASDGGSMTDTMPLTITIMDIDDESPAITHPSERTSTVRITDGTPSATDTGTGYRITITDADSTTFNFNINGGSGRFDFVDRGSDVWELVLLANQEVNEAVGDTITLTYSAVDGGGNSVDGGTITLDVVDTPVSFTTPEPMDLMADEGDAGWTLTLMAESVDETQQGAARVSPIASYEFIGDHTGFAINPTTGQITLTGTGLDYETATSHSLTVRATDSRTPAETGDIPLTITVQDVNEHAPAFTQGQTTTATISESRTAADGTILEITATDADGTNDAVTYSIGGGDPDDLFFIDPNSGAIRVADNAVLNYDTDPATTSYTLEITATDSDADNPMTATQDVIITLTDINDESPSVPNPAPTGTAKITAAAENPNGIGTSYTVTVSDADASNTIRVSADGDPRFDFVDRGNNVWELVLLAGQAILPSELGDTIPLTYRVTDDGVDTIPATGSFVLTVVDTPVSITPPTDAELMADENDANWALQLMAESDAGGGDTSPIATYEFVDGSSPSQASGIFRIDDNGRITITSAFDFEGNSPNSYELTVRATDSRDDPESDEITFTINVQNADDGAAQFTISGTVEAGETLTIANPVPDPDGYAGSINYIWYWEDGSVADINAEDRFKRLLDENDNPHTGATYTIPAGQDLTNVLGYAVSIEYTDNFGFVASVANETALNLYLATTTVNFAAGKGDAPQTITINENDATPANLPTLEATADGGGAITYTITGGNDDGKFQIGETSGAITLKSGALNYEMDATQYTLEITATDGAQGQTGDTNTATVIVNVRDLNEAPVFDETSYATGISENIAIGTAVGVTVSATDEDAGTNGQVRYAITGGNTDGITDDLFTINPTSGVISVAKKLDYDTDPATTAYMLEITATDGGDNPDGDALTDTVMVTITLADVNDVAPDILPSTVNGAITDGAPAGTDTGIRAIITDDAMGDDFVITYKDLFTSADIEGFELRHISGTMYGLYTTEDFDFEALDATSKSLGGVGMVIGVSDILDGTTTRTTEITGDFSFTTTDINDNGPTVTASQTDSNIPIAINERIDGTTTPLDVMGLTIAIADDDSASVNPALTSSSFIVRNADDLSANSLFQVVDDNGAWVLQFTDPILEGESDPTIALIIEVNDGTNPADRSAPFTLTVNNLDEGDATYAISGNVAEDATLTAALAMGGEDPDGVDGTVDVMYRWFTKSSTDPDPTSFEDSETTTFKWLQDEASTTNTHTIMGAPVAGAQYGVLVSYKDNSVGDDLSFTTATASALKFGASSYSGSIDEDGKNITTIDIDATLDDSADNITYAFVTDADAGTTAATHLGFAIDSDGVISFTGSTTHIDYDTTPTPTTRIDLTVRATYDDSDSDTTDPFDDVDVAITVNDLNDELPVLAPATAGRTSVNVFEASPTSFVRTGFMFTVTDADAADASFTSTDFTVSGDSRFGVEAFSNMWELVLKANTVLDYETPADRSIDLEITVEDGNGNISIALPVEVITVDQNDVRPGYGAFTWQAGAATGNANEEHIRTIAENINADGEVELLRIALTDSDTHHTQLRVSGGVTPSGQIFYITRDVDEAVLHMNAAAMAEFDYEDETSHTIWFTVDDDPNDNIAAIRSQDFIIKVMDVNDNDPVLTVTSTATIDEQTGPMGGFDTGIDFSVTDRDAVTYSQGDFEITDRMGNVDDRFQVIFYQADQEGDIYLKEGKTLEYDDGDTIELRLAVTDDQAPTKTITKDFTITLNEVADPITINFLDGKEYTATNTLYTATAEIGGTIAYTLGGTDADLFNIDSTSGAITFKATTTLDDDATSSYSLKITATGDTTEIQPIIFDVSSIRFTSADTGSNSKSFTDGEIAKTAPNVVILKTLTADTANNATVTYAITGGADMDLFSVRTVLSQGQGMVTKLELNIRGDFVRKAQYEVEITATNDDTMETDVQMYTHTISGYPETPPVIKLTLPDGQDAINYISPLDVKEDDTDIITFTIEDPDPAKTYAAGDISVVDSSGTADARFTVTWDEATQMGTLQATNGVDFESLDVPFGGGNTDPRWTETFIRVTDTPEGSIASGDDVRVVLRVADVDETGLAPATIPDRRAPQVEVINPDADPAPTFAQASYSATITQGAEIGSVITNIAATNAVRYRLADGSGLFMIDEDNGDITLAVPNARTDAGTHTISVIATDATGSAATARVIITDYAIRGTNDIDWGEADDFGAVRTLYGTDGADSIYGYGARDSLRGEDGDDTLHGGAGNDVIWGGNDNDTLNGGAGNDYLYGESGNDALWGGGNDDTLSGGDDNDTLNGDGGNDIIYGDNGADVLHGGAGKDYLYGGQGADVFVLGGDDDITRDFNPANGDKIRLEEFKGVMPANMGAFLTAANLRVVKGHIEVEGFDSWSDDANTINTAIYRGDTLVMVLEDFDADLTLNMFDLPNISIPAALSITASTETIDKGTTLTASITQDDPQGYDGGTAPASGWVWFYKSKPETDIGDGSNTYTVREQDAGEQIGVRLTYTDGAGREDTAETHLTEAVQRVIIKPQAEFSDQDRTYKVEADRGTEIEAGGGADKVQDGMRNDIINGGKGDDDIDLTASKEDNDVVIYGIGNQMASGGSDSIKGFVRGRDQFVFQIQQSDIDESGMTLRQEDGFAGLVNYITKGTEDLIDDQFWTNLNFDWDGDEVALEGISFHFQDSTFFSGGRISMPIVSIKFADAVGVDELREMFGSVEARIVNKQGLITDLDYLDDFLGGDDSVGFEII